MFTISKNEKGYIEFPNGLIIQWGVHWGSTAIGFVDYHKPFKNNVFVGFATMCDQNNSPFPTTIFFKQSNSTLFKASYYLSGFSNGSYNFSWVVIGF